MGDRGGRGDTGVRIQKVEGERGKREKGGEKGRGEKGEKRGKRDAGRRRGTGGGEGKWRGEESRP